jgi:hypothetical protein
MVSGDAHSFVRGAAAIAHELPHRERDDEKVGDEERDEERGRSGVRGIAKDRHHGAREGERGHDRRHLRQVSAAVEMLSAARHALAQAARVIEGSVPLREEVVLSAWNGHAGRARLLVELDASEPSTLWSAELDAHGP